MSEPTAFTDLEQGLHGPDGSALLRQTAGRLIALRERVESSLALGVTLEDAERSALVLSAIDAAERILIDFKRSGE
jgi:hypothetical protein